VYLVAILLPPLAVLMCGKTLQATITGKPVEEKKKSNMAVFIVLGAIAGMILFFVVMECFYT
jgi:hypothetical protein